MPWKGVTFDPMTGQNESGTPRMTRWRGGTRRVAWSFDLASGDLVYPMPRGADRK